jgi:hypothetical protein
MAMMVFGLIAAIDLRTARVRGVRPSTALMVGAAWVLFGLAGIAGVKPDATFALFIVPGALLLASAW